MQNFGFDVDVDLGQNHVVECRKQCKKSRKCVKKTCRMQNFGVDVDVDLGQNQVVECRKQCKKGCRMQNFWVLCRCRFLLI